MHSSIIIHHTEQAFEVALFINSKLHDQRVEDKRLASKLLIPLIDEILTHNACTLSSLSFLGINQGPGLFSTLRSIISTANGIHCATGLPLVGVDGLNATAFEYNDPAYDYNVTLLNAYNNEVYYAISHKNGIIAQGYQTIEAFLTKLTQELPNQTIRFIGNGTKLHQQRIEDHLKSYAVIPQPVPLLCSIATIAQLAEKKYNNNEYSTYLFPLHLKKHPVER